jgi:predicted RNA-binding protein YlqC (UPF0109 family)
MEEFVTSLIKKIVLNPDLVEISRTEDDYQIRLDVKVANEDFGKVIGKGGRTINSIRAIFNLYRHNHDSENSSKRVYINLVENDQPSN